MSHIDIPKSVIKIGESAFFGCKFEKVVIPENVEEIGNSAFYSFSNLKEVESLPLVPPTIGSSTFAWNLERVFVRAEALDAYKAAEYWSSMNIITMEDPNSNHALKVECNDPDFGVLVGSTTENLLEGEDYILSYKIKSSDVSCDITMTASNSVDSETDYIPVSVTTEWVEHRLEFTPRNSEGTGIAWYLEGVPGALLIDDVVLTKAGSNVNLMVNGHMEVEDRYGVRGWWCSLQDAISVVVANDVPSSVIKIDQTNGTDVDLWIVYSLDGRMVMETADYSRVKNLKPGLYIINGKKHLIH